MNEERSALGMGSQTNRNKHGERRSDALSFGEVGVAGSSPASAGTRRRVAQTEERHIPGNPSDAPSSSLVREPDAAQRYRTIVADPPWPERLVDGGKFASRVRRTRTPLPYPTMTVDDVSALAVEGMAETGCHLWLWTTNRHLEAAFGVMRAWGFKYLTTVTWVKPSGLGAYFASTTQHCLFGYYQRCKFPMRRWAPTHFHATPPRHLQKPEAFMDMVESISPGPRLELFARRQRLGWDAWGNEVDSAVEMGAS